MAKIEFRWLLMHNVDLDGRAHPVPMKIVYRPVNAPHLLASDAIAPFPEFDLSVVHQIDLGDCEPRIPVRRKEWSDGFYQKIQDAAFAAAITKRNEASVIAKRVAHYAKRGVIEIVSDDSGILGEGALDVSEAEMSLVAGLKA